MKRSVLLDLSLWFLFVGVVLPAAGLCWICAQPRVVSAADRFCAGVDGKIMSVIASCHPVAHDCVYCDRDRKYKEDK